MVPCIQKKYLWAPEGVQQYTSTTVMAAKNPDRGVKNKLMQPTCYLNEIHKG